MERFVVDAPPERFVHPVKVEEACEIIPCWNVCSAVHVLVPPRDTAPLPVKHTPLIAKQPLAILRPVPYIVVVPLSGIFIAFCTAKADPGVEVPMPTKPLLSITNAVEVAPEALVLETAKSAEVPPAFPAIEKRAHGVVVPTPRFPDENVSR